jgi:hypothetical protein
MLKALQLHPLFNHPYPSNNTADRKNAFTKGYNADKWGIALEEESLTALFPK